MSTSGMHRRPFEGRYLVAYYILLHNNFYPVAMSSELCSMLRNLILFLFHTIIVSLEEKDVFIYTS